MLNLIAKDIKLLFGGKARGKARVARYLFVALVLISLVALESYAYHEILVKLASFKDAPLSFTCLFLFIVSIIMMVSCLVQAEKLFFNESDEREMSAYPISSGKMIFSKMLLLFGMQFLLGLVFVYPIIISYGIIMERMVFFYFLGLFYPLGSFFFEAGVALVLVYPYHRIKAFLKQRPLIQFIVAVVLMTIFAVVYGIVLNTFLDVIAYSGINSLFTEANMAMLNESRKFFIVVTYLVDIFFSYEVHSMLYWAMFSFFTFLLGLIIILPLYRKGLLNLSPTRKYSTSFDYRLTSNSKALFKKELILLFRDSDNLFSFSGLLVVMPYLCYLVVFAMNKLFTEGALAYYLIPFPGLAIYINLFLVMCFTGVIASGGSDYISREKASIKILKTVPTPPMKQLWIKLLIPFLASLTSLTLSIIVLLATGLLSWLTALLAFAYSVVFLVGFNVIALMEEMRRGRGESVKRFWSTFYTYGVPTIFIGVSALLSFLRFEPSHIYLIGMGIVVIFTVPEVLGFAIGKERLWGEMEVSN